MEDQFKSIFDSLNNIKGDKEQDNSQETEELDETGYKKKMQQGDFVKEPDNKDQRISKEKQGKVKYRRKQNTKNPKEVEDVDDEDTDGESNQAPDTEEELMQLKDILKALRVPEHVVTSLEKREFETVFEYLEKNHNITFEHKEKLVNSSMADEGSENISEAKKDVPDWQRVARELVNAIEDATMTDEEFINKLSKETSYTEQELNTILQAFLQQSAGKRIELSRHDKMKEFLKGLELFKEGNNRSEDTQSTDKNNEDNTEIEKEETYSLKDGVKLGVMEDNFATSVVSKWDSSLIIYEGGEDDLDITVLEEKDDVYKCNMKFKAEEVDEDIYIAGDEIDRILVK